MERYLLFKEQYELQQQELKTHKDEFDQLELKATDLLTSKTVSRPGLLDGISGAMFGLRAG